MAQIPIGQKFHTVANDVKTSNLGSKLANSNRDIYTMQDIIDTTAASGLVTSVTGTAPIASSGGATPNISIAQATSLASGFLSNTDWSTFNNKQATLVSGTNIKTVNSTSLLGSGDVAVQPTLVSGTNIKTVNGTSILGSGDLVVSGGVTSVTGTAPVVSSGGATPAISMPAATNAVNGYLTSTDRAAFNAKQDALVSGTNIKTVNGASILGSGDLVTPTGIGGIHLPFGVASGNIYTNTVLSSQMSATLAITTTGLLGLTPFRPSVGFTASGFAINVTAGGGTHAGRVLVYQGNQDGTVTRVVNELLNPLTTGLAIVNVGYTFVAGTTYWMGWNCNFAMGSMTVTQCRDAQMAPLTLAQPVTTPTCNIGYSTSSFTTGTPPPTIDLSTYTETATNCVQIFIFAN